MNASAEFLRYAEDDAVPDQTRLLRVRDLAMEMATASADPDRAGNLFKAIHGAYLNLQMARTCNDPELTKKCLDDCRAIVRETEQHAEGKQV